MERLAEIGRRQRVKFREPPKLATRILQTFNCHPGDEAILGDLEERYQQGRTRTWYWNQIIRTIAVGIFHDIRSHKLLAVRALFGACFMNACLNVAMGYFLTYGNNANWTWWSSETHSGAIEFILISAVGLIGGFGGGSTVVALYRRKSGIVLPFVLLIMMLAAFQAIVAPDFDPGYFATISLSFIAGALMGGVSVGHFRGKTQ